MNELGMISAYSYYEMSSGSLYKSNQVSFPRDKKEASDDEIQLPKSSNSDEINDEAIISPEAKAMLAAEENLPKDKSSEGESTSQSTENTQSYGTQSEGALTPEQLREVAKLKSRDTEVIAHEQAHMSAARGINVSAPTYDYEVGPDGQKYAIGGEVQISFVETGDPQKDMASAETMKAAALAPAEPSSQDRSVAQNADKMIEKDRQEIAEQKTEQTAEQKKETNGTSNKTETTQSPQASGKTLQG